MVNGRWKRLGSLATAWLGVSLCWLPIAMQQYYWDDMAGGHLPYVPDAWYGLYQIVYERLGVPLGLTPYYFWGRFAVLLYIAALVGAYALPRRRGRATRVGAVCSSPGLWSASLGTCWPSGAARVSSPGCRSSASRSLKR